MGGTGVESSMRHLLLAPVYGYCLKALVVEPGGGSSVELLRDGVEETFGIDAFRNRLRGHVREELERLTSGNRGVIDLSKVAEAETAAARDALEKQFWKAAAAPPAAGPALPAAAQFPYTRLPVRSESQSGVPALR